MVETTAKTAARKKSTPEQYIDDVLTGKQVVSKLVRQTVERHQSDLNDAHERGLTFDRGRAHRVIAFFHHFLHHSKGEWAGQRFILAPWQQAFLWILFGWVRTDSKLRRFRFAYNELARGAGKSTLAAGIALYLLIADREGGAELYSAATKKDQAKLVHSEAMRMVKASPFLNKNITSYRDSLSIARLASKFVPLASDEDSLDGLNPHAIIADEVHAWKQRHLWDVLVTALGKRRQPMMFAITTAGFNRLSVCYEQHVYSEKVLAGIIKDDTWFAWIAGLDEGDDPNDEVNWIKANPGIGDTVKWDEIRAAHNKAKEDPGALNSFLRLRLNVWTQSSVNWMQMDRWDECGEEPVDPEVLLGRPCFGGMDLSTVDDISAFVLLFPPWEDDKFWRVIPRLYLPKDTIDVRSRKHRVPYDVWSRAGLFQLTEGNVIDYDFIREDILQLSQKYDIREIGYDAYNAHQIVTQLTGDGKLMVPIRQGFVSLNAPTKAVMEKVLTGELAHGNHPVMRWMVSNAVATSDPTGSIKLDKSKSAEKIDGIAALVNCFARAIAVEITSEQPTWAPTVW